MDSSSGCRPELCVGRSGTHHGRSAVRLAKVARLPVVGALAPGRTVTRRRSRSFRGLAPYRVDWALLTHSPRRAGCPGCDARAGGLCVTWLARNLLVCWWLVAHEAWRVVSGTPLELGRSLPSPAVSSEEPSEASSSRATWAVCGPERLEATAPSPEQDRTETMTIGPLEVATVGPETIGSATATATAYGARASELAL